MLTPSSDVIPALSAAARTTINAGSRSRGRVRCCDCPAVYEWLLRYNADSTGYVIAACSMHGVMRAGGIDELAALGRGDRGSL